jgi:putative membrane protein
MMWWHHGAWGAGAWFGAGLMMLVFWAVVIGGIVLLVRSLTARGGSSENRPPADEARRILDERFARGEITEEEYLRRGKLIASP